MMNKSGFTLLEIVIVIIIIGVLTSLALPRLWNTIELSRTTEARARMAQIRRAQETCLVYNDMDYEQCRMMNLVGFLDDATSGGVTINFTNQDLFFYDSLLLSDAAWGLDGWTINAYRKPTEGGGPWFDPSEPQMKGSILTMIICEEGNRKIKFCGFGPYKSLSDKDVNCLDMSRCN